MSRYVALSNEDFALLAQMLEIRNFDKRQQLVKPGDIENYINFIVKGLARKYFLRGRDQVITQIAKEGDFINSSVSFLSDKPSAYFVETIEASTFLSLSRSNMEKLYQDNSRFERLGRLMITGFFLEQERWEQEYLQLDTRQRYEHFVRENPDLLLRVQQNYLASYLNMKPETFSRFKHQSGKRPS